ncbi:Free methionine-(R)-sulfoxide reductase [Mycoplasmopsis meleagridis]|uniref:Free methionine-(R)-sulfoxide reductase,contains GAF domain n=1 Tax=Mycoplasmopsis meleagridis ATCC 25294 TaxID=1264554 RepID=A0A0F5H0W7_9BACT|nr:GAF domain-containing protein [Mycoplasmopsis meleagridis]KKB26971.1 Free methionine-(R)-sulfoxide reductase,contains GAF domain [Mycoplasmopsis meleagridis ATCC 25294]OAD18560.1 Free methionine-(R)-sulfoxide reductase [Mycoplasmopsis meleagridis]VEU77571.1 Free methionine-R-sulfoxide reductase [Mycoplasmopsis meleagridis]
MTSKVKEYKALIENTNKPYTILANTAAFIYENYENLNWAGFYIAENNNLYLHAFQGKVACTEISFNRGVCGFAARNEQVVVVDNVHEFNDHIACDSASKSELVVPIFYKNKLFALLDLDSPILKRFSSEIEDEMVLICRELEKKLAEIL